jgi:hypothetical protein
VVASVSHHSPLEARFDVSPQGIADAIKTGIETVALVGAQRRRAALENRGRELDLEIKALEAEQAAAQREQELELQRRERDVALREREVDIERKRLELEHTRLEIKQQRLELRTQAVKAAAEMIPLLYLEVSDDARPVLVQTLVSSLLELSITAEITVSTPALQT